MLLDSAELASLFQTAVTEVSHQTRPSDAVALRCRIDHNLTSSYHIRSTLYSRQAMQSQM